MSRLRHSSHIRLFETELQRSRLLTMTSILRGWHPDPFGVHELRYFTFDGNATRLVRDGEAWSHDAPPVSPLGSVPFPHMRSNALAPTSASPRPGWPMADDQAGQFPRHNGLREIYITKPPTNPQPVAPQTTELEAAPSGLLHHPFVRRIMRYCSVSVVSTAIGLTVLGVLVGVFGWPAVWANVVATAISLGPSFELSRRWVWAHDGRRSILRQAAPYAAVSFAGLIVSSIAVHLASNATSSSTRLVHTAAVLAANVAAYGALWIIQFVICDRILFRTRAKSADGHDPDRPASGLLPDGDSLGTSEGSIAGREVMV